jgi:predicted nucleic acid-binding Zn ribbon protein
VGEGQDKLTSTDRDYRTAKGFNVPKRQDDRDKHELLDDYRRRRVPVKPAKAVADVLSQLLVKRGYAQVQAAASCEAAWQKAAGSRLGPQTRCGNVKRGVLEVTVKNSAVLQELQFVKVQLIKSLAQHAPESKIRDVKFRVGTF